MSSSSRRTGRILPHQRDTDDAAPIIGAALDDIGDEYRERYVATLRLGMDDKTRKNYRSRIVRICKYWREKYPAYSAEGVRRISEEEARRTLEVTMQLNRPGADTSPSCRVGTNDGMLV